VVNDPLVKIPKTGWLVVRKPLIYLWLIPINNINIPSPDMVMVYEIGLQKAMENGDLMVI
jgi:hypothetical protein